MVGILSVCLSCFSWSMYPAGWRWANSLNTLAQNETAYQSNNVAIITGKGTELGNEKVLKGRAKRKMITVKMVLSQIQIAIGKGDKKKLKTLWNTYHCQSRLISYDGRLYGKYCKNRNSTLCCSIRKAEIINKYFPTIREWKDPYFITLTVKSVKANRLRILFEKMIEGFRCITAKYRKRSQREKGTKLVGIKSLECNFNPIKQTYNPHFHIIVENKEMGEILIKEWLAKWGKRWALRVSQDIRPVKDLKKVWLKLLSMAVKFSPNQILLTAP